MAYATDRRDLIKKALALAPLYVAPAVLVSSRPVMGQVISNPECAGANCQNFIDCSNDPNCVCFTLADGSGFCGEGVSCAGLDFCDLATPCATGFVCQVDTCCGADGICVPDTTQCVTGRASSPPPAGRTTVSP